MIISCKKAGEICNKAQYNEAGFIQRSILKFHLFFCKTCASFSERNAKLSSICDKAEIQTLSVEEKEEMKKILDL